jgi:large subunit ribosomal protein L25
MQRHPAKLQIMLADFQRIDATHALHVNVPLHFINEEECVGVKGGGLISHLMTEVEVSCLPANLPEFIEVDMANLDVGESIHLSEVKLPENVSSVLLIQGEEQDQAIASIHMPRGEKSDEELDAEAEAATAATEAAAAEE